MNVYAPWKIIRRKVRREEHNSKGFIRPLAECTDFARSLCRHEYDVPESVVAKGGPTRLSPVTAPACMATVIIRYRRGPTNILITSQYINYWPYNLAGTRRGISPRECSNAVQCSTAIHIFHSLYARRSSRSHHDLSFLLFPSLFPPFLSGFSLVPCTFYYLFLLRPRQTNS